ncbi:MAG: hypothetical protein AAGJ80_00620 [Cyanobacteria bacterium J06553_1]
MKALAKQEVHTLRAKQRIDSTMQQKEKVQLTGKSIEGKQSWLIVEKGSKESRAKSSQQY